LSASTPGPVPARPARPATRRGPLRALEAVVAAGVRAWSRAARPRPRVLSIPGLSSSTTVRFDEHGVPHVRAAGEADAFRAVGACHALDRFFQMDLMRRALAGRICEVVGERPVGASTMPPITRGTTLDVDRMMRCLDLVPAARRTLDAAGDEERFLVEAYCEGVNAVARRLGPRTSVEHALLRLPVEPWTPLDTCLVGKGMALGLSFKWRAGPVFAAIADALADAPDRLRAILPRAPAEGEPAVARWSRPPSGLADALSFLGWEATPGGSNAWVVGPARSASGFPILANDPHLALSLPSVWYLASVQGGAYAAVGATLPGAPAVVLGRTPSVAWGSTNAMLDDGDLWVEELDGTGTRYRLDGRWRDLEVETQEVRRRGGAPVLLRVRRTHRGPLLSDALPGIGAEAGPDRALSLRLTLHETTSDLQPFLRMGRARTAADVEAAFAGYGSPAQNLVWATTERLAGYRYVGRVPVRPPGEPALPRDGTTSRSDWSDVVPAASLPAFRIGPREHVVSANDAPVDGGYPWYLSNLYEPRWRADRVRALLGRRTGLTPDDMAAVQCDVTSLAAEAFRRIVVLPCAETIRATRPPAVPMLDRLLATGGLESVDAPGVALLHWTYFHLARLVFGAHLPEGLVRRWMGCVNLMDAPLLAAYADPDSPWLKPVVRATRLGEAMEAAARDLAERGHSIDARWGDVHRLTLRHPFSSAPLLGAAFTRGPDAMPGGPYTVQAGQYLHDRPASMVVGASFRQVVDLADPEGARMIGFGGQSGHVGSRHYDDLTPIWRRGGFIPSRLETLPARGRDLRLVAG
jgi:penicillin G amidase